MLTRNYFEQKLVTAFDQKQAMLLADVVVEAYNDLVKVSDFDELKDIVKDLAKCQRRTEQRMEEIVAIQQRTDQRMEELATAQQRTEQRVEELVAAQQRTEVAQQRTEQRVEELAVAQQRTEQRMEELATAQQRTEIELRQVVIDIKGIHKQLGGLSTTVDYTLENSAYQALPVLLERDFGLKVQGRLKRAYLTDNRGQELEINIVGQAQREGQMLTIIGESKSQLSQNHIDNFIHKRLQQLKGIVDPIFPVLVTHMTSSSAVEDYAKQQGIAIYYSYDFNNLKS
jgi:hypothetical protein